MNTPARPARGRTAALGRVAVFGLIVVAAGANPALAQSARIGPWIPIGSRLDGLVSWLRAGGALASVDPLERPYRLDAVLRAASDADTADLSFSDRRVLGWLRDELAATSDSSVVVGEVGLAAYRNGRRDTFRAGGAAGTRPMGGVWASLVRGPWVVVLNPAFENRLKDDPEFTGKVDRAIAGRLQTGYLAVIGERGDLSFGRMARQWGPALFNGLQLSPGAYATDMLSGTLRIGRFALTTIAQRLDDGVPDSTAPGVPVNRYFLAHRLTIHAGKDTWIAVSETGVYGGPGRSFEPAFLAPLSPGILAEFNEHRKVNLLWGVEGQVRLARGVTVQAQGMIDDIQIDKRTLTDQRPASGGLSIVLRGALPGLPLHASLGYTRVSSLTYRNSFASWETYTSTGVGIARNFSDYDQALLRLEARPTTRLSVTMDVSHIRQGSGDFRQPFPADSVLALPGQGFLVAPVQSMTGARISAVAEPVDGLELNGEMGFSAVSGGGTVAIASLSVRFRFDLLRRRAGGAWTALERGTERD